MDPLNPTAAEPAPTGSDPALHAPDSFSPQRPWWSLDRLGVTQAIGGLILGLIALFSSYDHISLAGHSIALQQQWGILCIAASVATVLVDAQLATRSRLRAAYQRLEERDREDRERNRAAEARERQREGFERLDQAALLSARVQLEPTAANRARLREFLRLMGKRMVEGG